MRNAELKGWVRSGELASVLEPCAIHSGFRIPHSAFGVGRGGDERPLAGDRYRHGDRERRRRIAGWRRGGSVCAGSAASRGRDRSTRRSRAHAGGTAGGGFGGHRNWGWGGELHKLWGLVGRGGRGG